MNYGTSHGVLKPQAEMLLPDLRWETEHFLWQKSEPFTTTDLYERLQFSRLNSAVPEIIRTRFETARNLVLYSWFVFEFHTVAEMQAFSTLEMALRMKHPNPTYTIQRNGNSVERHRMLAELLEWAVNEGFISPDNIPTWKFIKKQLIFLHGEDGIASDAEWITALADSVPKFRNYLAHGNSWLNPPESLKHVELCADIINALFPLPENTVGT